MLWSRFFGGSTADPVPFYCGSAERPLLGLARFLASRLCRIIFDFDAWRLESCAKDLFRLNGDSLLSCLTATCSTLTYFFLCLLMGTFAKLSACRWAKSENIAARFLTTP